MEEIIHIKDRNNCQIFEMIFNEVCEYQQLKYGNDYYTVKHMKTNQITYVKSGVGITLLNDKEYKIGEGDILIIPKGVSHTFIVISDTIELLHYHSPKNLIDDIVVISEGKNG